MGRKRGRGNFGGQSEQENTLNQLLVEMDGEYSSLLYFKLHFLIVFHIAKLRILMLILSSNFKKVFSKTALFKGSSVPVWIMPKYSYLAACHNNIGIKMVFASGGE